MQKKFQKILTSIHGNLKKPVSQELFTKVPQLGKKYL